MGRECRTNEEKGNAYTIFEGNPAGNKPLRRQRL
jgi:hypothetical protein